MTAHEILTAFEDCQSVYIVDSKAVFKCHVDCVMSETVRVSGPQLMGAVTRTHGRVWPSAREAFVALLKGA